MEKKNFSKENFEIKTIQKNTDVTNVFLPIGVFHK